MNRYLFIVTVLLIFSNAQASSKNTREINRFFEELTESLNEKNAEAVANSFSKDGELITLAGGIYKGKEEIKAIFNESFAGPYKEAKYEYFVQFVRHVDKNHAVVDGVWKVTNANVPPNYPTCGIFLTNLVKENKIWRTEVSYSSVPRQGHTAEHGRTLSWTKICSE